MSGRRSKREKVILVTLAVVVGAQAGLWAIGGKAGPLTVVPRIIADDIETERQRHEADTGRPLVDPFRTTLVICPELSEAIGPRGLKKLRDIHTPLKMKVIRQAEAPEGWERNRIPGSVFMGLCAETVWHTPIVAQVDVIARNRMEFGTIGYGHRVWFLFGSWMPGGQTYTWQFY